MDQPGEDAVLDRNMGAVEGGDLEDLDQEESENEEDERENAQERENEMLNETSVLVRRLTPGAEHRTLENDEELETPWSGILGVSDIGGDRLGCSSSVELIDFAQDISVHLRLLVPSMPIFWSHSKPSRCKSFGFKNHSR